MNKIQQSIGDFCAHLNMIEKALEDFNKEAMREEKCIFEPLERVEQKFEMKEDKTRAKAVQALMEKCVGRWQDEFASWRKENEQRSQVKKSLEHFAKGLIVAVFGRTNAGKSTLGNFIRGKSLRESPFPTPYNPQDGAPFSFSPIKVVETVDEEQNAGGDWFKEGAVETTREAQLFTGHGLTWLDTPGFGSVNDKGLGSLAKKYVEHADLIIYLDLSESPGLREHAKRIADFLTKERKVCLVLAQSDKVENVRDANGKILYGENDKALKKRVGKAPSDRKAQEQQELTALSSVGADCDAAAISISILLASEAVRENDERKYAESNIDAFFDQFKRVMPDEKSVKALKKSAPAREMIGLIDFITKGNSEDSGLSARIRDIETEIERLRSYSNSIDVESEGGAVTTAVMSAVRPIIRKRLDELTKNGARGGSIDIDVGAIQRAVSDAAYQKTGERARRILKDFWDGETPGGARELGKLNRFSLKHLTETHDYEVSEARSYARDPDGFWETVGSWFGQTYTAYKIEKVKKQNVIDLGYDTDETAAQLLGDVEGLVRAYAGNELGGIKERCLESIAHTLEGVRDALYEARDGLLRFRKELETRC